jgi:hypothetical protein
MKTGLGSCKLNNKHTRAPVSSGYHVILVVPFCSLLPKFSFSVATETALALLLETVTEAGLFLARPKLDDLAMVSCSGKDIVGRERAEVCGELSCMAFSGWPHGINHAHVSRARRRGMGFYTSSVASLGPDGHDNPKGLVGSFTLCVQTTVFLGLHGPETGPEQAMWPECEYLHTLGHSLVLLCRFPAFHYRVLGGNVVMAYFSLRKINIRTTA